MNWKVMGESIRGFNVKDFNGKDGKGTGSYQVR
jgi:hypothetical protein